MRLHDIEEFNVALSLVDVVVLINCGTSLLSVIRALSGHEGILSDIVYTKTRLRNMFVFR